MPIANINDANLWYEVMGQGEPLSASSRLHRLQG